MSDYQLIVRDDSRLHVSVTQVAQELKDNALAQSGIIGRVTNDLENQQAIDAQVELKRVMNMVEADRKTVKAPVLEFGKLIDATAKNFTDEVQAELNRVAKLTADYAALIAAKARAAEAARIADLERIEREKQQAIAAAQSHDEIEAIQEEANVKAHEASMKVIAAAPVPAAGQVLKSDWDIEVLDVRLLARCHPQCVDFVPRKREIRSLLDLGVDVQGVSAKKVTKSSVRTV